MKQLHFIPPSLRALEAPWPRFQKGLVSVRYPAAGEEFGFYAPQYFSLEIYIDTISFMEYTSVQGTRINTYSNGLLISTISFQPV